MADVTGDEDYAFMEEAVSKGVRLGVDMEWTVHGTEDEMHRGRNMQPAHGGGEQGHHRADEKAKCGARLAVAALRTVPKELGTNKVRLIHDGAYSVDVNRRIRFASRS